MEGTQKENLAKGRSGPKSAAAAARRKPRLVKSRLLADMRWVYEHPEGPDQARHVTARNWLDMDPRGFLARLTQLETALSQKQVAQEEALSRRRPSASLPDPRTQELTTLCDRVLEELSRG